MEVYKNLGGDSGVVGYQIEEDRIIVEFSSGAQYSYTYRNPGIDHVEEMKELARAGKGLNSYINRNVKYDYDKS
ncbi:MAG: hypothetical protein WCX83_03695 [Candidatus Cloacimonas sp.]